MRAMHPGRSPPRCTCVHETRIFVALQVKDELISGDTHSRDAWPLQTWAYSDPAITKEALTPQEADVWQAVEEVKLLLTAHPGDYNSVQRILGHKKRETTVKYYYELEAEEAFKHFDAVLLKLEDPNAKRVVR